MEETSKAVVAAGAAQLPAGYNMEELVGDSGAGVVGMTAGDVALPYVYVLQPGSPQVNAASNAYIEGAQAGMFFITTSGKMYEGRKDGIVVVPCGFDRRYVEWKDRDAGEGGWVADHPLDSDVMKETRKDDRGRNVLGNGHLIIETAYQYVLFVDPDTGQAVEAVIPMKSTMLKTSRRWNQLLTTTPIPGHPQLVAPRWLYPYRLRTVGNQKGQNSWFTFEVERLGEPVSPAIYSQAKAYAAIVAKGEARLAPETDNSGAVDGDAERVPF